MSRQRTRPGVWAYALATLIPVLGCLLATAVVYRQFPALPGTLEEAINLDDLTQIVVPGSTEIALSKPGAYAIYHEYHSVVDGTVYAGSKRPPALACDLTCRATGERVAVAPDYVPSNTYVTKDRARAGVLIGSITVDEPGVYTFRCLYPDGTSGRETVLAVGPNFVWEFFGIAGRTIVAMLAGVAVLAISGALVASFAVAAAIARHRAGRGVAAG